MEVGDALEGHSMCVRAGCTNPAVDSTDWDREYCSNECVADHCRWVTLQPRLHQRNPIDGRGRLLYWALLSIFRMVLHVGGKANVVLCLVIQEFIKCAVKHARYEPLRS